MAAGVFFPRTNIFEACYKCCHGSVYVVGNSTNMVFLVKWKQSVAHTLAVFLDSELGVMSSGEAVLNSAAGNYFSYPQWWCRGFFVLFCFLWSFFFWTWRECNGLDKSPGRKVVLQSNWLIEYKRFPATKIIYSGYLHPCSLHAHVEGSFFFK